MKTIYTIRDLTTDEIPWLPRFIPAGTMLYESIDVFNCCTSEGIAVSELKSGLPYFEIPLNSFCETFHKNLFGVN